MPLRAGTWRCCSGRGRTGASETWNICAHAAKGGHLEVLRWARENGCEWDRWTCSEAATRPHWGAAVGAGERLSGVSLAFLSTRVRRGRRGRRWERGGAARATAAAAPRASCRAWNGRIVNRVCV